MSELKQRRRIPRESKEVLEVVKKVDFFPKVNDDEDFEVKTICGALMSLFSAFVIIVLILSEMYAYIWPPTAEHIVVDHQLGEKLQINFDITFPALRCSEAHLDVMDVAGDQMSAAGTVWRQRLDAKGQPIGHPFREVLNVRANTVTVVSHGDHVHMENTAHSHEGEDAGAKGEGCRTYGQVLVNKVAGNFHVALGSAHGSGRHVHQFLLQDVTTYNASHRIHKLSFGPEVAQQARPLDGTVKLVPEGEGAAHFQYFIKVVPTTYTSGGRAVDTYQFSVTEHTHFIRTVNAQHLDTHKVPGVFFIYDLSPFRIMVTSRRKPLWQVLTSLCAIVGGVLTVSAIVDSLFFHGSRTIRKVKARVKS